MFYYYMCLLKVFLKNCVFWAKITNKPQNNYYSELSENWAVWKSDNQGIKEVTFIHMGRRGRDMEMWKRLVPHTCVVDKNWEGYLGSEGSQPHTSPLSPGSKCQEDRSPSALSSGCKASRKWVCGRNCGILRHLLLKGPQWTYIDSLSLGSSFRAAAWRAPVAYREEWKCLASGGELGDTFLPDKTPEARQ